MHSRLRPPSIRTPRMDVSPSRRSDDRIAWIVITSLVIGIISLVVVMS